MKRLGRKVAAFLSRDSEIPGSEEMGKHEGAGVAACVNCIDMLSQRLLVWLFGCLWLEIGTATPKMCPKPATMMH